MNALTLNACSPVIFFRPFNQSLTVGMTENQEVPGRKRRSSEEIKRLVIEFDTIGLRQNEFRQNHGLALSTLQRQLKKRRFG
jgi:hypothetical protein